jgi:hypothetical protein
MILEGFEVSWNVKVYADLLMECEYIYMGYNGDIISF